MRELKQIFELPQGVFPVVLVSTGYPKTRPAPRRKLGVDVVVHDEKYRELDDRRLYEVYQTKYPQSRREIKEDRLQTIESVCRQVHGDRFARRCVERIREQGYISVAHNYFGLHYRADQMPERNEEFLSLFEEFGFGWFKKFHPKEDKSV